MKKFLTTILCVVYVLASSGATISFHYCMGKFIGLNMEVKPAAQCANCGMSKEQKKGCCNDKRATFQIKKDQLAASVNEVPINFNACIQNEYSTLNKPSVFLGTDVVRSEHSPPLVQVIPSFLLNCVFRI